MTSKYERTFSVSVPVERAWRAFTDPADLEQWFTTSFDEGDDGRSTAASPGGPVGFEVVEADPRARLRYRQWGATPERGIDVTIVFESDESGTKITMTQSGFGGETIFESDEVHNGMDETLADLVLYLDYGIAVPRHRDMATNASLGAVLRAHAAGPLVGAVNADGFAGDAGLQPGDLLVQLGRAPMFRIADVACFLRLHEVGDDVEVGFVRNGAVHRSHASLGPRDLMSFAHNA
jgi:uncharacterized protein YndB with AHSA1/START domain